MDTYRDGELIIAVCPKKAGGCGKDLTSQDILEGWSGLCPFCGLDLAPTGAEADPE